MILIVSPEQDPHAQAVRTNLNRLGAHVTVLDLAEFPQQAQVAMNFGMRAGCYESIFSDYDRDLNLSDCNVVWWRQPQPFILHPELTDRFYRSFAYTECHATIAGLWLALDAFWVNHPMRNEEAVRKPYQLKMAQQAGLTVPETLITNNPHRARAFVHQLGVERTVYRTFSASANTWQETRLLQAHQMALLDNVCYAPVVFQEHVTACLELRLIMTGEIVFAAAMPALLPSAETAASVNEAAPLEPYTLPVEVETQVRTLMRRLDLVYGVLQLRITPEGRYVFMELDPGGTWLDVEERTDLPISAAIAQMLYTQDRATASSGLSRFKQQA